MRILDKPKRFVSEYTKGRSKYQGYYRKNKDLSHESWEKLVSFQSKIGIRRNELKNLKKSDYIEDSDGENAYVVVRCGKGGKRSLIYIAPEDRDFIKQYFDATKPDEYVFSEEMSNQLNLHYLRAMRAQALYKQTVSKLQKDKEYREKLEVYVKKYWTENNFDKKTKRPKPFPEKSIKGRYCLRGKNKAFAVAHSLPTSYDRLALKFVSMAGLQHFRESITILYLLYV